MSTSATEEVETLTVDVSIQTRCLVRAPNPLMPQSLLVLATHGYGMTAEEMMGLVGGAVGEGHVVASLEGPNQQYLSTKPGTGQVGYNWGTPARWQQGIRVHHEMLLGIMEQCADRFGLGPERTVLSGFSQPVGLNYRFAATHPEMVGGVIGVCGGLPRDWEADPAYQKVTAPVLHIARDQDEYYPNDVVAAFPERLRRRVADVEFHLLPGAHRFPSRAAAVIQPWLNRVFEKPLAQPVSTQ